MTGQGKSTSGTRWVAGGGMSFVFEVAGRRTEVATQVRGGEYVFGTGEAETVDGQAWVEVRGGALSAGGEAARGERGWMLRDALVEPSGPWLASASDGSADGGAGWRVVRALSGLGYAEASRKRAPAVVELPAGAWVWVERLLKGDGENPLDRSDWCACRLADGRLVWVQSADLLERDADGGSREADTDAAAWVEEWLRFLGRPYVWGGSCGFGLDCSGLVTHGARWRAQRASGRREDAERDGHAWWLPHSAKRQLAEDWPGFLKVGTDRDVAEVGAAAREAWREAGSVGRRLAVAARERWSGSLALGDVVYFAMGGERVDHVGVVCGTGGQGSENVSGGVALLHASSAAEPGGPSVKVETLWPTAGEGFENILAMRMVGVRRMAGG